ncbi:hypothetical protein BDV98DRAFT_114305 [Pterulicium gracile]|uniref:Uncharacterized protein n=1 Tax=Pterulicium gracile TaxID=1884261 RepID=A0A5C3QF92_9AGAR|nr:hypothetical protein BDV98DRAFT_114305 [Pterula gracilis]
MIAPVAVLIAAVMSSVAAGPTLVARAGCTPSYLNNKPTNIEGINYPFGGPGEWRPDSLTVNSAVKGVFEARTSPGEWRIVPSIQDASKYNIRSTGASTLALSVASGGGAKLATFNDADATQRFTIECETCGSTTSQPHSFTCTFRTSSNECITSVVGGALSAMACQTGFSYDQSFDFLQFGV